MAVTEYITFSVFLLTFVSTINCGRILVYAPTPSISHQVVFRPLSQALAARGHEVIVVTPNPAFPKGKAPANLTEIDVHDISYQNWDELFVYHQGKKEDIIEELLLMFKTFATIADLQLNTPEFQEIMKQDKNYFDVMLLEGCNRVLLGLTHKFDAPTALISSLGAVPSQYSNLGAPVHPILYPTPGRQKLYNLTMFDKIKEIFNNIVLDYIISMTEEFDIKMMQKNFGLDVPNFESLSKKIDMMLLNEHPLWGDNRPVPPNVIRMGGIHQAPEKELPEDLKKYLDSSKHGVIYVSFGTNVLPSQLPPEQINIMTKVFSQLPFDILWKYDKDVIAEQTKNIKISNWFPQADLLRHPNVKLFITQGGLQSTDETITAGVPAIGIPLSSDQWYNVEKYVHHKIGLQLDITTLNEKDLKESIETVINDKSFKDNILRLRSVMRAYPIKPADLAVWWVEHLMTYGGSHLKSPAAHMSWTEYYEVKLMLILFVIVIVTLTLLVWIVKVLVKFALNINKVNVKLKNN